MAGETKANATCRFIRRPGRDDKTIVVIQVRRFLFFWKDCYPIDNAVRALEHEAIELYDRLIEIQEEQKRATKWVAETRAQAMNDCQKNGKSPPFPMSIAQPESEMPDFSEQYKQVMKAMKGQAKVGTVTNYTLKEHNGLVDLTKLGDERHMEFRPPEKQSSRNRGKGGHHHKQGGQHSNKQGHGGGGNQSGNN